MKLSTSILTNYKVLQLTDYDLYQQYQQELFLCKSMDGNIFVSPIYYNQPSENRSTLFVNNPNRRTRMFFNKRIVQ